MIFYIFFLVLLVFLGGRYSVNNKYLSKNLSLIFSFVFIILFAMLRFDVGYDYPTYWHSIFPDLNRNEVYRWELFPRFLALFCNKYRYPWIFFVITSVFSYTLVYFGIKKYSVSYFESIVIYISLFFLSGLSTIRQTVAVSIVFYATRCIFEHKMLKYIVLCIFACLWHKSAFIAIPIYFVYNYINIIFSVILLFIVLILKVFIFKKLKELGLMLSYIDALENLKGGSLMRYFYILITAYLFFISLITGTYNKSKRFFSILILGFAFPIIFGGHMGLRFAEYYNIYLCFAYPVVFSKFKIKERALTLIIFYFVFIFTLHISTSNPTRSPYIPYQTILFIDKENFKNLKSFRYN